MIVVVVEILYAAVHATVGMVRRFWGTTIHNRDG